LSRARRPSDDDDIDEKKRAMISDEQKDNQSHAARIFEPFYF
jgi:hypothetical protein